MTRECDECGQLFEEGEMVKVTAHDWVMWFDLHCYNERQKRILETETAMLKVRKSVLSRIKGRYL